MCAIALLFDCAISKVCNSTTTTVLTKSFVHFFLGQRKESSTEMFGAEAEQDEVAGLAENDQGAENKKIFFFSNIFYLHTSMTLYQCFGSFMISGNKFCRRCTIAEGPLVSVNIETILREAKSFPFIFPFPSYSVTVNVTLCSVFAWSKCWLRPSVELEWLGLN